MYFTESPYERSIERMMTSIPNFRPRGSGVIILCEFDYSLDDLFLTESIAASAISPRDILLNTMSSAPPAFFKRLNQYLQESENTDMTYIDEKHMTAFTEAIKKSNKKNYALLSAVYLLSANRKLWNAIKKYVKRNEIHFGMFYLRDGSEDAYTLLCAAKDLYLGTKHLTLGDLADTDLISKRMFGIICNAMAIRRFGLAAVRFE